MALLVTNTLPYLGQALITEVSHLIVQVLWEEYNKLSELAETNPELKDLLMTNTLAYLGMSFVTAVSHFIVQVLREEYY